MEFCKIVTARYSCKKYDGRMITEDQLLQILYAGRMAPTAKNLQEQRIYVVKSKEMLQKIDECTPCRYNAPVVLVIAYDKNNVFTYPGGRINSGVEDAAIVATHMMLAATDAGVDNCWINFFDPDKLHDALNLPENEEIVMLLDLGFAAPGTTPMPNHLSRKAVKETVTEI